MTEQARPRTKLLVHDARARQQGGGTAAQDFARTGCVAVLMPEELAKAKGRPGE